MNDSSVEDKYLDAVQTLMEIAEIHKLPFYRGYPGSLKYMAIYEDSMDLAIECLKRLGRWYGMSENTVRDYRPSVLKNKRMAEGLSQRQLEQAVGAKPGDVARWEYGKTGIPAEIFKRLAFVLRCDGKDLMMGGKG